jgi:hypothetical protein
MTIPSLFLGWLMASACGLLFHVVRGGRLSHLLLYLIASWIAFFLGNTVGNWLDWQIARFGTLNLFPAFLATLIGLITASILIGPEKSKIPKKK